VREPLVGEGSGVRAGLRGIFIFHTDFATALALIIFAFIWIALH
jgi:hypothetical protein